MASGADRAYFSTCSALEKRGVEIAHFATAHPKNEPSPWSKYFPRYHDFSQINLDSILAIPSFIWNKEAARKLDLLLHDFKPDIAHLHNIYHHLTPSILPVLKKHGVPVVMTVHDFNLLNPNYVCYHDGAVCQHSFYGGYYKAILHQCVGDSLVKSTLAAIQMACDKWYRLYEKNVDAYIFSSNFYHNKFLQAGFKFKRGVVMPNYLADDEFFTAQTVESGAIAFSGRLVAEKGVEFILKSLEFIKTKVYNLSFVGDGPLANRLEKSGFKVYRGLSKQARENFLSKQQFILAPSLWWDNSPHVILEAYGLHRPIIGTKFGGIPEMIEDGITGLLVEPNNAEALAEAIDTLLQQPHLCQNMGERGFHLAKEKYNEEYFVVRLLALYGELS